MWIAGLNCSVHKAVRAHLLPRVGTYVLVIRKGMVWLDR